MKKPENMVRCDRLISSKERFFADISTVKKMIREFWYDTDSDSWGNYLRSPSINNDSFSIEKLDLFVNDEEILLNKADEGAYLEQKRW